MFLTNNNLQRLILCLLFFTPLKFISAAQLTNNDLVEFSLSIHNLKTDFKFPTRSYQVEMDQLGISWYESFSQYFHAGLEIGYIDMTQIENPLVSAQFSSGQFAGIRLRFLPIDQTYISLRLNLNYRYTKTEADGLSQNSEFAWHETLFSTELELRPFNKVSLIVAVEYQDLSGEQRDSGNISQVTQFNGLKQEGYQLTLKYEPYANSDIGVEWLTGHSRGGGLYFRKRF